jgi:hypothetical protein
MGRHQTDAPEQTTWRSPRGAGGHVPELAVPTVPEEIRELIREMRRANCLWGALWIHGEMLKPRPRLGRAATREHIGRRWRRH